MPISVEKFELSSPQFLGRAVRNGQTWRWWVATWPIPDGEDESEWLEAVRERVDEERILDGDQFDTRASFEVEVRERLVVVNVQLVVAAEEPDTDEYLDAQARDVVGVVTGLMIDWD